MPIKAQINLYSFKELKERGGRAYDKAREWLVEGLHDNWYDFLIDRWSSYLEKRCAISKAEVNFSGFWSQGDGACFHGMVTDFKQFMEGFSKEAVFSSEELCGNEKEAFNLGLIESYPDLYAALCADDSDELGSVDLVLWHRGHYSHEHSVSFDWGEFPDEHDLLHELETGKCDQEQYERWLKASKDYYKMKVELPDALRKLMRAMYRWLEESYEWHVADEQLIETAEANDYVFYEDGRFAGNPEDFQ